MYVKQLQCCIQLFRERWSEKVYATIRKGAVGGFEFIALQRNLKEWHERPRKATRVSVRNSVRRSYPILPFGIVACTFFRQLFSK